MREKRMSKYIVSIVLALAMVIGIAVFTLPATTSAITPSSSLSGAGTELNPYKIGSAADWLYFANLVNGTTQPAGSTTNLGYFQLTADITFNEGDASTWGSSAPAINLANYGGVDYTIGNVPGALKTGCNPFVGTLDGNGHTISGVYINKTGGSCGLFASTAAGSTATIKNLIITNSYYESDTSGEAGALIGQVSGGETYIENVFVTDSVYIKSAGTSDGGILGHCGGNDYGDPTVYMDNCVNGATVNAYNGTNNKNQYVGGLIGNGNGKQLYINNCLNYGTVIGGTNYLAGLVGRDDKAGSEFNNCVNIGTITPTSGTSYKQIVISNSKSKKPILTNCLALTTSYGNNTTNNNCSNISAADVAKADFLTSGKGSRLGDDWVTLNLGTYVDGDQRITQYGWALPSALVDVLTESGHLDLTPGYSYESETIYPAPAWVLTAWNSGTINIGTVQQWTEVAKFVSGLYDEQCTDGMAGKTINLTADLTFNTGSASNWLTTAPANDMTSAMMGNAANPFKGTFEGNGHTISGFYIYTNHEDGTGLFGLIEDATVENLVITNSCFRTSMRKIAAAVGQMDGTSTVASIYVTDSVYVQAQTGNRAGIVSTLYNTCDGVISNCVNAANISLVSGTSNYAGGILANGNTGNIVIEDCLNLANISGGSNYVCGIAGAIANENSVIDRCVNLGTVQSATNNGQISSSGTSGTHIYYNDCFGIASAVGGRNTNTDGSTYTQVSIDAFISPGFIDGDGSALADYWTALSSSSSSGDTTTIIKELCIPNGIYDIVGDIETSYHAVSVITPAPAWVLTAWESGTVEISSAEEWKEFAKFFNGGYDEQCDDLMEGKTLTLTDNITFNTGNASTWGTNAPANNMTTYMIGSWANPFKGNFDGQGYTISGFYGKKTVGFGDTLGLFGSTTYGDNESTLENVLITNSYFECADGCVGALIGQIYAGTTNINNIYVDSSVYIISSNTGVGGIVGHLGQGTFDIPTLNINSCVNAATVTSTANSVGGILGNSNQKNVYVSNCLNLGAVTGANNVGGIIGYTTGSTTGIEIIIEGCVNAGTVNGTGSNVAAISTLSDKGTRSAIDCVYVAGSAANGVVSGTDNSVVEVATIYALGKTTLPTGLNSDYWTVRGTASIYEICIPTGVEPFAPQGTRTTNNVPVWLQNYDNASSFTINSAARFKEFANFVNGAYTERGNFDGKTVLLSVNVSLNTGNSSDWATTAPTTDCTQYIIGTWAYPFCGTFNGQGHSISGFYAKKVDGDGDTVAIFGATTYGGTCTIENLLVTNSYFECEEGAVAAVVAQAYGGTTTLNNIYVTESVYVVSGDAYAGGVIAHLGQGSFDVPTLIVDSCVNAASVSAIDASVTTCTSYAGIVGNGNQKNVTITNCLNMGAISGYRYVGGIIGFGKSTSNTISVTNCVNMATISTYNTNANGKACAIAYLGDNDNENVTASGNFYVSGTGAYGIYKVNAELEGGATATTQKALSLSTLISGLPSAKWTARGDEASNPQIREVCIPTGVYSFAPRSPYYRAITYLSGQGTSANPYTIGSISDYESFVALSEDDDFAGKYISLTTNLTFNSGSSTAWLETAPSRTTYPVGLYTNPFRGIFLGNGHTISGLYVIQRDGKANDGVGMFSTTGDGANISNLYVKNSVINDVGWAGTIAGQAVGNTTISGIYVDEDVFVNCTKGSDGNTNSGGIIGGGSSANNFTITVDGCVFAGIVYGTGNYMGGIVGNGNGSYRNVGIRQHDVVINNCICFGQVGVGDGAKRVGGLIGANRAWTTITHSIYAGGGSKADYPDSWGYVNYPIGEMAHATVEYCYTLYTNGDENKGSVMKAIMTDDESVTTSVVYNAIDGIVNVISPAGVCSPSLANFTSGWTFRGTSTTSGAITSGTREIAIPTAVASFAPQSKFYKTFRNLTDTTLFTGDGDEANPYVIRDVAGLQRLATVANANDLTGMYFVLKSGFTVNSGKATDWAAGNNTSGLVELTPIGNEAHPFNAFFDGYGKTIKGIYMENTGECTGLFGVVGSSATIKNTKISNSYFKDTGWVGAFVASLNGGTLDGMYAGADVIVEATSNVAGGIAGGLGANGSTIKNCVFTGTVTAAGNFVGGILGNGDGKSLTIYDCLNTGDVTGNTYVAGIVGRNDYAFSMQRCINVGAISGTSEVYALTASNSSSKKPVVKYCYYINTLSAGKNLAQTSNSGTTLEVICGVELPANLGDTWQLRTKQNGDAEYITITKHDTPVPKSIAVICAASKYTWEDAVFHQIIFAGAGTESSPYLISTVEEYQALAVYSTYVDWEGTYFKLANNIVVNEGNAEDWGSKAPAIRSYPIGSCDVPFRGTLDGNNKMLKGLYIISSGVSDATSGTAVFGSVGNGAYIHNLKISNSYFKNDQSVAAIVGQPRNAAVIENCYVASDVIVKCASSSGGIVGQLGGYNEADEYGSNDYTLEITSCVFAGKIIGSGNYIGGILGNGNNNSATGNLRYPVITKCLFAGSLTGKSYISGILGRADSRADVEYCVSIGQVGSSNQGYVSGILCSSANYEKEDDYVIVKNNYCVQALPWIVANTKFSGRIEATNNNNCSYLDFYGSSATSVSGFTKRSNDIAVPSGVSSMAGTIFTQRVETGASVRMSSPTGIRFTAEFSDKYLNGVVPDGGVLTGYGLMIAPKAYVDAAGGFTFEKLDTYSANNGNKITYVNVNGLESGNSTLQKSGYKVVNLVLGNVKSANYETLFSAVAYVVYNIDGETKYIYSAYDKENNARTIASVARAAVEDVSESSTTGYTNDYTFTIPTISKKQKSKKWDWDLWEYVYTYEYSVSSTSNGHLYRPYTSSQLATLQSFYSQELRVYQQNILNEYGASNYGSDVVVSADYQTQTERGIRMLKQIEQMRPDVMGFCEDSEYWTTYLNAAFGSKYTFLSDPNTGCDINEANTIAYLTSRFSLVTKGKFSNGPDPSDLDSQHTVTYEGESYHAHYSRFTRWAKLSDSNTGKTFVAAATHLDHNGSGSSGNPYGAGKLIRAGEAATAREQLATIANGLACFYVGDFNDGWTVESMLELETESAIRKLSSDKEKTGKGFFEISASDASERYYNYAGNNVTYHYYNERTHGRLDYCFYKDDYATAIRYRILMRKFKGTSNVASYPSDHYGLVSDFLLK